MCEKASLIQQVQNRQISQWNEIECRRSEHIWKFSLCKSQMENQIIGKNKALRHSGWGANWKK